MWRRTLQAFAQVFVLIVAALLPACTPAKGGSNTPAESPTAEGRVDSRADAGVTASGHNDDVRAGATADATSCSGDWLALPSVPSAIAIPAGAGAVLQLHASAVGTQDYRCETHPDGGVGWSFVGPEAELDDCHGHPIAHHFAAEAGVNPPPEWRLDADQSYAIGRKVGAFSPDAGAPSIPWLLLRVAGQSDAGVLAQTTYVQRLRTDGGVQPAGACKAAATPVRVPYTADYYFYGR